MTCDDVTGIDFNLDAQKVSVIPIEEILVIKGLSDCDSCGSSVSSSIREENQSTHTSNHTLRALASKVDLVITIL